MTSITPERVRYEVSATLVADPATQLDVDSITPFMDMDGNAFCGVMIRLKSVTDAQWALLDPRTIGVQNTLYFNVKQLDADTGAVLTELPVVTASFDPNARLYLREAELDEVTGEATVFATSGEPMLSDKRRISGSTINTGATTVETLFTYSLYDIFGGIAYGVDPIVSSTAIPAGDRRLMLQGESHLDLLMPEMQAIDCRIYDYWGRTWWAKSRTSPPSYVGAPTTVKLATYTQAEGAPSDADPIVHSARRKVSREGDWADGILVRGEYTNAGGTRVQWWQASGAGVNTRGRVIDMNRAQPASNVANQIATRSVIRGAELTITAAIRFDVRPGQTLTLYTRTRTTTVIVRAVEWDVSDNLMTIRAETGNPI